MSFQFCWEYKDCDKQCPVKDMKILYCWKYYEEEARAGLRNCPDCEYRKAWVESDFKAEGFKVAPSAGKGKLHRKVILVIDDEPNILYAFEEMVQQKGYECVAAQNGQDGLLIACGVKPDLVISDIIMPRLNGYELCNILKTDPETSDIPVILVTVKGAEKERLEGNLAGADAYIIKPFSPTELAEKIDQVIGD
jgi:CheY-like chemotaxis protein